MDSSTDRPSYEPEPPPPIDQGRPATSNAVQRLWTVFFSPGEVFKDIGVKPTWVLALVLMVLLGIGAQFVILPHVDAEATLRARLGDRAEEMTNEQIDNMIAGSEKFMKFAPLAGLVIGPIAWALMAAFFFILLKMVGSEADFQRCFSTTLYAYWPATVVQLALFSIMVQRIGKVPQQELENVVKSNLGAFLAADAPKWLSSAAGTISIFNIWTVILLVIGFTAVGRLSRGKAAVVALVPWIVWIVGKAGVGAIFG